jgi:hypothetical protein
MFKYLIESCNMDLLVQEGSGGKNDKDYIDIAFNMKYMLEHRDNLVKILSNFGIENLSIRKTGDWLDLLVNQYKKGMTQKEYHIFRYKMYYQISGILRVLFEWYLRDMPMPVDDMVTMLNLLTINTKKQYPNMPNIRFHVISE